MIIIHIFYAYMESCAMWLGKTEAGTCPQFTEPATSQLFLHTRRWLQQHPDTCILRDDSI